MLVKILHVIPSPRANIAEVQKWQGRLPFDRFIPYFMWEPDAYYIAREFFLKHTEYTHMAIGTDDIVVKPEHLLQLEQDLKEFDYPVLGGMMNINEEGYGSDLVNLTTNTPSNRWFGRQYDWIARADIPRLAATNPIITVRYNGFALLTLRRDFVEKFAFESDAKYENIPAKKGGAIDVHVCWNCHLSGIEVKTDTRIDMRHLRRQGTIRVEKEKPFALWWKKDGKRIFYDICY